MHKRFIINFLVFCLHILFGVVLWRGNQRKMSVFIWATSAWFGRALSLAVFLGCFLARRHGLEISLRKLLSVVIDFGLVGGQRYCASVVMPWKDLWSNPTRADLYFASVSCLNTHSDSVYTTDDLHTWVYFWLVHMDMLSRSREPHRWMRCMKCTESN